MDALSHISFSSSNGNNVKDIDKKLSKKNNLC